MDLNTKDYQNLKSIEMNHPFWYAPNNPNTPNLNSPQNVVTFNIEKDTFIIKNFCRLEKHSIFQNFIINSKFKKSINLNSNKFLSYLEEEKININIINKDKPILFNVYLIDDLRITYTRNQSVYPDTIKLFLIIDQTCDSNFFVIDSSGDLINRENLKKINEVLAKDNEHIPKSINQINALFEKKILNLKIKNSKTSATFKKI